MFRTVLVANRGEIAVRIIRTLRRMGVRAIAICSDVDRFTPHALEADSVEHLRPSAARGYLDIDAIVAACHHSGSQAVHPGYGFLAENPDFAERLDEEGIVFIGPRAGHIRKFAHKHAARELATSLGVLVLPGSGLLDDLAHAEIEAERIGFPVILKSTAGGGGIGLQTCNSLADLRARYDSVRRMAVNNFSDGRLFLEAYVVSARHIEVQIFGDGKGQVVALGTRDCSLQRRHQKIIEEAPAFGLDAWTVEHLYKVAVALAEEVTYESAGTVEFLYDVHKRAAYFLEMNTRLQVEHCVTEATIGIDLVEWMVQQAAGDFVFPNPSLLRTEGVAIEARLYAEDPARDFRPSIGRLTEVTLPDDVRVESWIARGTKVTPFYDPLLAKLIARGADRETAVEKLRKALARTEISGVETNLDYLRALLAASWFRAGTAKTATLGSFAWRPMTVEVLAPGTQSSLQDWPGRIGYWHVGVPPSGPMDDVSFRLANRIVGNPEGVAALELTLNGPTLRFNSAAMIALSGARMSAALDGVALPWRTAIEVRAGQILTLGTIEGPGLRAYLAVRHGFAAPTYLGSAATFTLGKFGGHATGALCAGDILHRRAAGAIAAPLMNVPESEGPMLTHDWEVGVLYGPHGAPDFFRDDDIATLFQTTYEVHFNSSRTGVRLVGPKPTWARQDGGEAGLHPSNIHDNAYAIGAIDFTGDTAIILGPDGPSLGGFVCPAVVVKAELWKIGQMKSGDRVRFHRLELRTALARRGAPADIAEQTDSGRAVLYRGSDTDDVDVLYRAAGDDNILIEFGPMVLDFGLRLRVHQMMEALAMEGMPGVAELTPGVRSLQVHYDGVRVARAKLIDAMESVRRSLPPVGSVTVPSRIVHLPLSWNDSQVQSAVRKYMETVRPDAPWCPSNIEFIRRINGLEDDDEVRRIIFDAHYLVMGLGDVYLGAPVATPLDPSHRLVTTKYNPARTWTPENAVGIGGAYLCIYGMEGPGGYQLFGRTIQMWNAWRSTAFFAPGTPWLLRFFDQIRFFPVSESELEEAREAFPHGAYAVAIEETSFSLTAHRRFVAREREAISAFEHRRTDAFAAERGRWAELGLDAGVGGNTTIEAATVATVPDSCHLVTASASGMIWRIIVAQGEVVTKEQLLLVIESMKMELMIEAPKAGLVREIYCAPGQLVRQGEGIMLIDCNPDVLSSPLYPALPVP
jgi:urea carboxylase